MKTKLFSICALCVAVFMSVPVSAETFDELMKKAQAGDANSQYTLAQKYKNGEGVAQDKAEAVRWHTKAAEQGHIFSQFTLAEMYKIGDGIPVNKAEAAKWYLKAAEQGNSTSQSNIAEMYYNGDGIPQNYAEAAKWYRKVADRNDFTSYFAQYNLAEMYVNGYGVEQNYTEAVNLYRKAAARNFDPANHKLGMMYYNGYGVPQDYAEAMNYYKKAADNNYSPAQSSIGYMYFNGEGVQKNEKAAVEWWEKAAANGDVNARKALSSYAKTGKVPASSPSSAKEGIDVPDFASFGEGLDFGGQTESKGYTSYSYSCDATANTDAAEKYIAELTGSYDFVQTAHEPGGKNRKVSKSAKTAESWFFKYTGSKEAKRFEIGRGKNKRTCHVAVQMTRDAKKNRTSFSILVADGLVYGLDTKTTRRNK